MVNHVDWKSSKGLGKLKPEWNEYLDLREEWDELVLVTKCLNVKV